MPTSALADELRSWPEDRAPTHFVMPLSATAGTLADAVVAASPVPAKAYGSSADRGVPAVAVVRPDQEIVAIFASR